MSSTYRFIRPFLDFLPPELSHQIALNLLANLPPIQLGDKDNYRLEVSLAGIKLTNPVGLAAGFDKDGIALNRMHGLGFGFVEIGSVTPLKQSGNPRPRLFRLKEDQAVINRMGFNNAGHSTLINRLEKIVKGSIVFGVSLGANKNSEDPVSDFVLGVERFAELASYLVINISSPNTPGLRDLQQRAFLKDLLEAVKMARDEVCKGEKVSPFFLKISPDLTDEFLKDLIEVALKVGVNGLIISNTTVERPRNLVSPYRKQSGGLSGKPLMSRSTDVLATAYNLTGGNLPLIGTGGISCGKDAYAKICAGASAVQLYTAITFQGLDLIRQIKDELLSAIERDGFSTISEAIGSKASEYDSIIE